MSNETEREAFEAWAASVGYHTERDMFQREKYQSTLTWELWQVWQAGAAYQRSIDKGLVEALESIAMCADGYSGAECSRIARSALKPYRAAQEGK